MKVLFDIISLQGYHNGGEEYVRIVLQDLLKRTNVDLVGIYDSSLVFLDNDHEWLSSIMKLVNVREYSISEIVTCENIDTFFIGIGQRYSLYNLDNIQCRTICVIHDIGDIEYSRNKIHFLFRKSLKSFINLVLDYWLQEWEKSFTNRIAGSAKKLIRFAAKPNVEVITVSNYTANSLCYYFPELKSKSITVLYPPVKKYERKQEIDDDALSEFLNDSRPYLLFLNFSRLNKNGEFVLRVFRRLKLDYPDFRLIVTGAKREAIEDDILYLKYVSFSDIENLYKRAWALVYPSFTEGFGYPPIEAMKYGTPVIVSNVCSMPEVLGNAPLYFSPFYENDLYNCFVQLANNHDAYSKKALADAEKIEKLQNSSTAELINLILKRQGAD